jgi:hypothetical protein
MAQPELYEKIWIKSEKDFPKESELVLHENYDGTLRYSEFRNEFKNEWIEIVKWYFKPIDHPLPGKSAEEILSRKRLFIKDGIEWIPLNQAKSAMEEFASQGQLEISDSEIETKCKELYIGNLAPTYFTNGAKWYRSELKKRQIT